MGVEAWPTEAAATVAVEAAARAAYERDAAVVPKWDDLETVQKLRVREAVLPLAWAMLEALPDPRHAAWAEGLAAGWATPVVGDTWPENPYPSGL